MPNRVRSRRVLHAWPTPESGGPIRENKMRSFWISPHALLHIHGLARLYGVRQKDVPRPKSLKEHANPCETAKNAEKCRKSGLRMNGSELRTKAVAGAATLRDSWYTPQEPNACFACSFAHPIGCVRWPRENTLVSHLSESLTVRKVGNAAFTARCNNY